MASKKKTSKKVAKKAVAEKPAPKKAVKSDLEKKLDNLAAKVRKLEQKAERRSANWKEFAKRYIGSQAVDGKMLSLFFLCAFVSFTIGAGEIENWSNTQNGTLRFNRVSSGVNSVEADTFIGNLTGNITATGIEVNGDITLANDETIDNATDGAVRVTYNDDAVVLGTEIQESDNVATNIADGDEFRKDYTAYNDATQSVDYARIVVDLDDVSDTTEDGAYEIWVQKAGTLTAIATIDASGITVVGDVSGTTIGGVTEANILDKSATETVGGAYTFTNASFILSNLPTATNGLATGQLWNNSNVINIMP